jgi:hypothetical protein
MTLYPNQVDKIDRSFIQIRRLISDVARNQIGYCSTLELVLQYPADFLPKQEREKDE